MNWQLELPGFETGPQHPYKLPLTHEQQSEVRKVLREVGFGFFTVAFITRADNRILRVMNCRMGVQKFLKNGKRAYDPSLHNLVTVWTKPDPEREGDTGYRSIPIENVVWIKSVYKVYTFTGLREEEENKNAS
jgi:hypothetical protein